MDRIDVSDRENLTYFKETNRIHSDEKWYFLQDLKKRLKIYSGEIEADADTTQHKSHRTQVMVTTAISEPTANFDGKVALQIHTTPIAAARNSINRPAGKISLTLNKQLVEIQISD